MTPSKPIIGVTGNSGSGKGAACAALAQAGGFCIDADQLAHKVMEPGQPAYTDITALFGKEILAPGGSIDRKALGGIVFRDAGKKRALERVVHSRVKALFFQITEGARPGCAFVAWDAPLLYEAGMHLECSAVLLIAAPYETKLARITGRDGITAEQAKLRLSAQPPEGELYARIAADLGAARVRLVENTGSLLDLKRGVLTALEAAMPRGINIRKPSWR